MKNFINSFNEFLQAQTLSGTKPTLCYDGVKFRVSLYFSKKTLSEIGWEVVCG